VYDVLCQAFPTRVKGKERKDIYIAPFCTKVHTKRSRMDHTVLPANNTIPHWGISEFQGGRLRLQIGRLELELELRLSADLAQVIPISSGLKVSYVLMPELE